MTLAYAASDVMLPSCTPKYRMSFFTITPATVFGWGSGPGLFSIAYVFWVFTWSPEKIPKTLNRYITTRRSPRCCRPHSGTQNRMSSA